MLALLASAAALLSLSCASTALPYDTGRHLEARVAELLPADLQGRVEVPFRLSDGMLDYVTGRINPSASNRKQVDQLLDLIFSGVGLKYSLYPTRNAEDTFAAGQANCLSFVHLFVGVARSQRLNPFYVEVEDHQRWSFQSGTVVSRGHIVAGMYVDGALATYDFLPYRPKSYRDFEPIDDLTAMAHHYNNLGAEALLANNLERAEPNLQIATKLAPHFDKALNNLGVLYLRQGRLKAAAELYESGREEHPAYVPILNNLARVYQELGRGDEALAIIDEMADLDQSSPFFALYKGQLALGRGEGHEALEHMRDALRIDSEIPEVHLGLVRVYLSLGEIQKARHHVERALKLDATHEEARRYAALIERGMLSGSK